MAKYVDADKLLAEAIGISGPFNYNGWDNFGVYSLIERQPAVDVVEVVRCRDCVYSCDIENEWCKCENTGSGMRLDGYCSDGERRNNE